MFNTVVVAVVSNRHKAKKEEWKMVAKCKCGTEKQIKTLDYVRHYATCECGEKVTSDNWTEKSFPKNLFKGLDIQIGAW